MMSVSAFCFHVRRTMPSIERQISSGFRRLSFVANSTNNRSGRCRSASCPTRNTPRSEPVPPMAAWTSLTVAFVFAFWSQPVVMLRQPFMAVIEPPRYATVTVLPAFSLVRKFPTPSRARTSCALTGPLYVGTAACNKPPAARQAARHKRLMASLSFMGMKLNQSEYTISVL